MISNQQGFYFIVLLRISGRCTVNTHPFIVNPPRTCHQSLGFCYHIWLKNVGRDIKVIIKARFGRWINKIISKLERDIGYVLSFPPKR
jgi:hypothetical protein